MPQPRIRLIDELARRFPDRPARELAALVIRGLVRVDGEPVRKPGSPVRPGAVFELPAAPTWVSRGGAKLAAALADTHPGVRAELPRELAPAHVDAVHGRGAAGEQAVGESSG